MLQQQSREEASGDPQRAPAPAPDAEHAVESFSIMQPVEDSMPAGASEACGSDIGEE
jgi:hypothetical protein